MYYAISRDTVIDNGPFSFPSWSPYSTFSLPPLWLQDLCLAFTSEVGRGVQPERSPVMPTSQMYFSARPFANLAVYSWALRLLIVPGDTRLLWCWPHPYMNTLHSPVRGTFHWYLPSAQAILWHHRACAGAQISPWCIKEGKCVQNIHTYYPPLSL